MPDGWNFDFGFATTPTPPKPPKRLWPTASRPQVLVDQYRVMLADPDGNIIGLPSPVPMLRQISAQRHQTRNL